MNPCLKVTCKTRHHHQLYANFASEYKLDLQPYFTGNTPSALNQGWSVGYMRLVGRL
jgi:hypothetical protein